MANKPLPEEHPFRKMIDARDAREKEFFDGFEPKTIKIDPIGPTAELRAQISRLESRVRELEQALRDIYAAHRCSIAKAALQGTDKAAQK